VAGGEAIDWSCPWLVLGREAKGYLTPCYWFNSWKQFLLSHLAWIRRDGDSIATESILVRYVLQTSAVEHQLSFLANEPGIFTRSSYSSGEKAFLCFVQSKPHSFFCLHLLCRKPLSVAIFYILCHLPSSPWSTVPKAQSQCQLLFSAIKLLAGVRLVVYESIGFHS